MYLLDVPETNSIPLLKFPQGKIIKFAQNYCRDSGA